MKDLSAEDALKMTNTVLYAPINLKLCKKILKLIFKEITLKAKVGENEALYTFYRPGNIIGIDHFPVSDKDIQFLKERLVELGYCVKMNSCRSLKIRW